MMRSASVSPPWLAGGTSCFFFVHPLLADESCTLNLRTKEMSTDAADTRMHR